MVLEEKERWGLTMGCLGGDERDEEGDGEDDCKGNRGWVVHFSFISKR